MGRLARTVKIPNQTRGGPQRNWTDVATSEASHLFIFILIVSFGLSICGTVSGECLALMDDFEILNHYFGSQVASKLQNLSNIHPKHIPKHISGSFHVLNFCSDPSTL